MSASKMAATACVLVGLVMTAVGAGIAAKAVIITQSQARELAATKWNENEQLKSALLDQSRKAKWGLITIVIGTALQILGTILPLLQPD